MRFVMEGTRERTKEHGIERGLIFLSTGGQEWMVTGEKRGRNKNWNLESRVDVFVGELCMDSEASLFRCIVLFKLLATKVSRVKKSRSSMYWMNDITLP